MAGALQDRGTFRGIAATLLALALLAERTAGRCFPVRFLVLTILGRAEAIARVYVAREIAADGWCLDEPPANHYGAAGAELLALRLRTLAAVLDYLSAASDCSDAGSDGGNARSGNAPDPKMRGADAATWRRRAAGSRSARIRSRCRDRPCQDRRQWPRDWPRSTPLKRRA
mgnify:CR=1 FL=1